MYTLPTRFRSAIAVCLIVSFSLAGCSRSAPLSRSYLPPTQAQATRLSARVTSTAAFSTRTPAAALSSPTPDSPHVLPTLRADALSYTVVSGDTLGAIASLYGVTVADIMTANSITDENSISVGQVLTIPAVTNLQVGSTYKVIPDSELVNGPAAASFDVVAFIKQKAGYLSTYKGDMEGVTLDGSTILADVARDYSVNPRLLLAILEYQSGWLTKAQPDSTTIDYPMAYPDANRKGLYKQLAFVADALNHGFYLWQVNGLADLALSDNTLVAIDSKMNAGTVGLQYVMSQFYGLSDWQKAVGQKGIYATYTSLFGNPFDYAVEPLLPARLTQPTLQLPFEKGDVWAFTGGPHAGWGSYAAWAALDFAPPGQPQGCVLSSSWVVAMAPGLIVRSESGEVVEDLDEDGYEQTGWTILYMHIDTSERVAVGTKVAAGDHIGHPSCEGGVSDGTHVHLARRYNGEWIAADGSLPFNMDGWISSGTGTEYDGYLTHDGQKIEAWGDRSSAENQIQR